MELVPARSPAKRKHRRLLPERLPIPRASGHASGYGALAGKRTPSRSSYFHTSAILALMFVNVLSSYREVETDGSPFCPHSLDDPGATEFP